jgi:hypothetical protein
MRFVLLIATWFLLAACSNGPGPAPPPENAAEMKADARAREEFARNLPKPPEH